MAKIAIRADGGSQIGMGHIMRTLVLAKELVKTNEIFYICRIDSPLSDKYKGGIEKIKSEGFEVKYINETSVIEGLKRINADCLITDSYEVDEKYFDETKNIYKKTGYIDDMNLYYFNVDFIINQNFGAENMIYRTNEDTKLFLGTKYLMLREEFRNYSEKVIKKNVKDILITVGGSDNNKITNRLMDFVKDMNYYFHVVVGPAFKDIDELEKFSQKNSKFKLYYNANMPDLMNACDLAISSSGSTLYELMTMTVPTIGIVIADNQRKIAVNMHKSGLIYNIGDFIELDKLNLNKRIECFDYYSRVKMSAQQKHNVTNIDFSELINSIISEN